MASNSNILMRWHNKLTAATLKNYQDLRAAHDQKIKPHSLITVLAILGTIGPLSLLAGVRFENVHGQGVAMLTKALTVPLCMVLYVVAFYNWRVFFHLRKDGINKDKNLFFAESAGLCRKIVFYLALLSDFLRKVQSYLHPEDIGQRWRRLKFQLRSEYYHDAAIAVLESIVLSVLLIELARIIFPSTFDWSDKKHAVVVILLSFLFSLFRVFFLHLASGHGVS